MRTRQILVLCLLLPFFSGCVGTGAQSCRAVMVPLPHGGDSILYDATGRASFATLEFFGDWEPRYRSGPTNGLIVLAPGSTLQVTIAESPTPRMAADGFFVPAYQVGYRVASPGFGFLDMGDEWLSEQGSRPIQVTARARDNEVENRHFTEFGDHSDPPVFGSGVFWGKTIRDGDHGLTELALDYPGESFVGTFSWNVQTVVMRNGICQATLGYALHRAGYPSADILNGTLTFVDSTSFPVSITQNASDNRDFKAERVATRFGLGAQLAAFNATWTVVPRNAVPAPGGAPQGINDYFETPFSTALAEAKKDSTTSAWLTAHPNAQLSFFKRIDGVNGTMLAGSVIDGWEFQWSDGLDILHTGFEARQSVLGTTYVVYSLSPIEHVAHAGLLAKMMPASYFVDAWKKTNGGPPNILTCYMETLTAATCEVKTHAASRAIRAGQTGAGREYSGLLIDAATGQILQDNSWNEAAIGPPVHHPNLN